MKQPLNFVLFCILLPLAGWSQQKSAAHAHGRDSILISGRIAGTDTVKANAVLYRSSTEEIPVGNGQLRNGRLTMKLDPALPQGVYRLHYNSSSPNEAIDLIITGEPVNFELDLSNNEQPIRFTASPQNEAWYGYRISLQPHLEKIAQLTEFINRYPDEKDPVAQAAWKTLELQKDTVQQKFQQFVAAQGASLAGKLVKNNPLRWAVPRKPLKEQQLQRHLQYWQGINTTDTMLLNSSLYPELIYNYIGYYLSNNEMNEEQMTKSLQDAVDTVVQKFGGHPATRNFALQYLTKGFRQLGQEAVVQYIDEKYNRTAQCSAEMDSALQKRLAAYAALKQGQPAPDIQFSGMGKNDAGLKDIQSDTLIVAFWASWCNHCKLAMPKLNELAAGREKLKVLAVSLDDNPGEYMEAARKLGNMLHLCDYRKWNSKPAVDYNITATPTFFMLDKERRIIGKYTSAEGLAAKLKS